MIQKFKEQLVRLEGEYARLAGEYRPGFRTLDQVGAQVAETRSRIQSEIKKVVAGLEAKYIAAVSKETKLRTAMEEQKALALQQKDASVTYNILAREANTNRQLYDAVLQRMKETGVAAQVGTSNIFVIVKGARPIRPSSPTRVQDVLISALLALVGGIGLAFLLESLNNTYKNPNEVERHLGLSTLAVIPEFVTANGNRWSASRLPRLGRKFYAWYPSTGSRRQPPALWRCAAADKKHRTTSAREHRPHRFAGEVFCYHGVIPRASRCPYAVTGGRTTKGNALYQRLTLGGQNNNCGKYSVVALSDGRAGFVDRRGLTPPSLP